MVEGYEMSRLWELRCDQSMVLLKQVCRKRDDKGGQRRPRRVWLQAGTKAGTHICLPQSDN